MTGDARLRHRPSRHPAMVGFVCVLLFLAAPAVSAVDDETIENVSELLSEIECAVATKALWQDDGALVHIARAGHRVETIREDLDGCPLDADAGAVGATGWVTSTSDFGLGPAFRLGMLYRAALDRFETEMVPERYADFEELMELRRLTAEATYADLGCRERHMDEAR